MRLPGLRVGPVSLRVIPSLFQIRAQSFFETAERQRGGEPAHEVACFFLYARATELALKGFLLARRRSLGKVRKLQHNLELMLREAEAFGLQTTVPYTEDEARAVAAVNLYYEDKDLEYPELQSALGEGFGRMPRIEDFAEFVRRLVVGVKDTCNSEEARRHAW